MLDQGNGDGGFSVTHLYTLTCILCNLHLGRLITVVQTWYIGVPESLLESLLTNVFVLTSSYSKRALFQWALPEGRALHINL
ncbi:hypothetical protein VNO77_21791 [Canavalia gladiata]|uniref:Uncharacterized protein n=1 Tax=Canavalia gladiata TaxID=3824 RepID=A0AAN9L4N1_CANGL